MNQKKKDLLVLALLLLVLLGINYNFLDSQLENFLSAGQAEKVFVERVIDGDTIVTEIGNVRLLGINTPERGEKGFEEAKEFLEGLILKENVTLEFVGEREDKYGRILAYVFFKGENINLKLVKEGFGNYYFYGGRDVYSDELEEAWNECIAKEMNLCEKSQHQCASCISIDSEASSIINNCDFSCDVNGWEIKEEGRDKFVFDGSLGPNGREEIEFDLDLENTGGSLFLRDGEGKFVGWG